MQKLLIVLLVLLTTTACSMLYQPDLQQGNVISASMLHDVKLGMNKEQVSYLIGTPTLLNPFQANRWDYVYTLQSKGKPNVQRKVTLWFTGDRLTKISPFEQQPS